MPSELRRERVCIIGGGPSGMAMLAAFCSAEQKGVTIPEVVCLEKQPEIGGLWNLDWRVGLNSNGDPSHSSMYKYLWSNGPKECLEMGDYTFEEHFKGKNIPSFPPREVLRDYLLGRANKYDIKRYVRTGCVVRDVRELSDESQKSFEVRWETNNVTVTENFDYVVVATGHFHTPHLPHYEGVEMFDGRVLHAHAFYNAMEFKDKAVVIIGSSYSAEDISLQLHKYGVKSVTISHRTKPMGFKWPDTISEAPAVKCIAKDRVHFVDGTAASCDAIIFCTGYRHSFPFMQQSLALKTDNILYPQQLYKGCVFNDNTRLFYLGMQDQCWTFTLLDCEAWYTRDVVMGKIQLPGKKVRENYANDYHERCTKVASLEAFVNYQKEMVIELFSETDYPKHDNEKFREMFMTWLGHKQEDIMTYRDKQFTSIYSGKQAPRLKMPWAKAYDDSLEGFVKNYQ